MISVKDYQDLLEKRQELQEYFDNEFENLANNSEYRRKKCVRRCKKETEKELYFAINTVWRYEVKQYLKGQNINIDVDIVKVKKENKFICWLKKILHIKPKQPISIAIETKEPAKAECKATYKEEISAKPISTETIDGQMDIEELDEEEIYE